LSNGEYSEGSDAGGGADAGDADAGDAALCPSGEFPCRQTCCGPGLACVSGLCAIPSLSSSSAGELRLWVTADRGLDCVNGRATSWTDQSPAKRSVSTTTAAAGPEGGIIGTHAGPVCNAAGHTLGGIPVPYFDSPNDGPPYVNGSFDVDLSVLSGTPFTIFVVERRWARTPGRANWMLGTLAPPGAPGFSTLQVGYVDYTACPSLAIDLAHDGALNSTSVVPSGGPAPASIDSFVANGGKMRVWVNGSLQSFGSSTPGLLDGAYAANMVEGSIGRAFTNNDGDGRFPGDIAEVLVFTTGLADADRQAVEAYLERHWGGAFPSLGPGGPCP
jgi:hypothetical protein